uniref:Uncharacterized protein n=1 Tax=Arion vulgaris TaxID=1028688 RepID=A0A0B6XXL8_9EUPU
MHTPKKIKHLLQTLIYSQNETSETEILMGNVCNMDIKKHILLGSTFEMPQTWSYE